MRQRERENFDSRFLVFPFWNNIWHSKKEISPCSICSFLKSMVRNLTLLCAEQNFKTSAFTIRVNINVTKNTVSVRLTD
jgi:hypothetical protein